MTNSPALTLLSPYQALASSDTCVTLVSRIMPQAAPRRRPALFVVLALDVSASMSGEPLAAAVATARALVVALGSHDTLACVTFSSTVELLVPPTAMDRAGRALAEELLLRASAYGETDLAWGATHALEIANLGPGKGRVLLLTDGCPTRGVRDFAAISRLVSSAAGEATLSTFGFGRDVDAGLLADLAGVGRGSYSFIETNEAPVAAIGAELGGLLDTVAMGVTLELVPAPGVTVDRVYRTTGVRRGDHGSVQVSLPALVAEEEQCVVSELSWAPEASGRALQPLLEARLRYRDVETGSPGEVCAAFAPCLEQERGRAVQEAFRAILLAHAAAALDEANTDVEASDIASRLERTLRRLTEWANSVELADAPDVAAALSMLERTLAALRSRRDLGARLRQDVVAAAAAARQMKGTMLVVNMPGNSTTSQRKGMDLLTGTMSRLRPPRR